jgi:hypothetical protein
LRFGLARGELRSELGPARWAGNGFAAEILGKIEAPLTLGTVDNHGQSPRGRLAATRFELLIMEMRQAGWQTESV